MFQKEDPVLTIALSLAFLDWSCWCMTRMTRRDVSDYGQVIGPWDTMRSIQLFEIESIK